MPPTIRSLTLTVERCGGVQGWHDPIVNVPPPRVESEKPTDAVPAAVARMAVADPRPHEHGAGFDRAAFLHSIRLRHVDLDGDGPGREVEVARVGRSLNGVRDGTIAVPRGNTPGKRRRAGSVGLRQH